MSPPINIVPEYTLLFLVLIGLLCTIYGVIARSLTLFAGTILTIVASVAVYLVVRYISAHLIPLGPEMITAAVCFPSLLAVFLATNT